MHFQAMYDVLGQAGTKTDDLSCSGRIFAEVEEEYNVFLRDTTVSFSLESDSRLKNTACPTFRRVFKLFSFSDLEGVI